MKVNALFDILAPWPFLIRSVSIQWAIMFRLTGNKFTSSTGEFMLEHISPVEKI